MMLRKATIIISILILGIALPGLSFAKMLFGPYLQSISDSSVMVCAYLEPGDTMAVTLMNADTPYVAKAKGIQPACATLSNLDKDVEHRYDVKINGQSVTKEDQPSFISGSSTDATLIVFGDTRSGDDSFDISHRQIVKTMKETTVPDAIIHTGDFVETGDDFALWTNFFLIEDKMLETTPIYPAIGRSDQPSELMEKIFPILSKQPWYSFDRGGAHFAVLKLWRASSQPKNEVDAQGDQASWLRQDLGQAKEKGIKRIFIFMHQPAVDIDGAISAHIVNAFEPIFEAYNVTAVFSGAHYFSHRTKNQVHYFTNGGGGAALDARTPPEGLFTFFSPIHHFIVLETGQSGAKVRAINSNGDDFYQVSFDRKKQSIKDEGNTFVTNYGQGPTSVPITYFFLPDCEDCEELKRELEDIAKRTGTTLVVTFRSLETAENLARLKDLTDQTGPTPIIAVQDEVMVGIDQARLLLEDSIVAVGAEQKKSASAPVQWIIFGIVIFAALVLLVLLIPRRKGTK